MVFGLEAPVSNQIIITSHSFSKRTTISGIAKGGTGHAPILQTICCHHKCSFKLKMYQNVYGRGSPRPVIGWGGTPLHSPPLRRLWRFERGPRQPGWPRAPKCVKTALLVVTLWTCYGAS